MLKPKTKRTVSLAIALVFLFTVIMPMSAFAADNDYTKYSGTYTYITADDNQKAGTATVQKGDKSANEDVSTTVDRVQVKLTLPPGVEFTDKPTATGTTAYDGGFATVTSDTYTFVKSDSSSVTLRLTPANWDAAGAKFDFSKNITLDIDSDFTGNVDVTLEVWGLHTGTAGAESIVWSESDTVTIAKVSGSDDVMVSGKDPKTVSNGSNKKGADIKVYETQPGLFGDKNNDGTIDEVVVFDIMTNGVTFHNDSLNLSNWQVASFSTATSSGTIRMTDDDQIVYKPAKVSSIFPGDIVFTPKFDVDPDVTGEIKIRVSSAEAATNSAGNLIAGKSTSTVSKTTVVSATVGDAKAKVEDIEDNDTIGFSGQIAELDVEITIETEDGQDFKDGDMMTFVLNKGKFVDVDDNRYVPTCNGNPVKLYNNDKGFYVTFGPSFGDSFTLKNFYVQLDNDVEPGDITLDISGDYGDLDEITIGVAATPITISAEKTPIMSEALNQKAGDIIITETDDAALKADGVLVLELPSGIELNGKPKMDVEKGNFDGDLTIVDDKYIAIEVEQESSEASEIRIYNINYDTGRLALNGDVELKAYFIDKQIFEVEEINGDLQRTDYDSVSEMIDEYDDTGVIARVANATVANDKEVVATFTVGDEGVAVVNGRTLVQVNKLCDVLGMQKSWDETTKTAYFVLNGKVVAFPMGENAIYINGTKIAVDQGGKIIDNYTYATLRGIQMAFGGELEWDDTTKTATFKFVK